VVVEEMERRRLMSVTTYLSDLVAASATNGLGPVELDKSVGGKGRGDGKALNVGGKGYAKGLGVRPRSVIVYDLGGQYETFQSVVGVDREAGKRGSVTFEVYVDGKKVFASGKMVGGKKAKAASVDVAGKNQLKLIVTDAGNGKAFDSADWADAKLISEPPPPPAPGPVKPTAANTGPYNAAALVPSGSFTVTTDGAVVENVDVTGTITIDAKNVTLRNFRVNADDDFDVVVTENAENVVIEDGELTGSHMAALYGPNFTARRLNIHDVGVDAIKPWSNVVIDSCYIHELGTDANAHADGVQESGGDDVTITNNNIDVREYTAADGKEYRSNAAVFVHTFFGGVQNVLIAGNWLNGGNYTVYSIDAERGYGVPVDVRLVDNTFGDDFKYGLTSM
jgi:hypothetical protein